MVARLRARQATRTESPLVFPAPHGGLLHGFKQHYFDAVRRVFGPASGINVHALRHSWASRMAASGCDLVLLKELGGWHSLTMVSRYSHATVARGVEAVARMLAARDPAPALPVAPVLVPPRSAPSPRRRVARSS